MGLQGTWDDTDDLSIKRASSVISMETQMEDEMDAIRGAVINREGLLLSVFDVLRRIPRRVLMVLKLNDLTRYVKLWSATPLSSHSVLGALIMHWRQHTRRYETKKIEYLHYLGMNDFRFEYS